MVVLAGDEVLLHTEHDFVRFFVGGQPAEVQRRRAEIVLSHLVQVFQLFLVPGRWEKAVIAVPVEAPLLGQKMRHDVAAGDDVEDVALAPALFQAAI